MTAALLVFALTYGLIATRRFALLPVGRAAGALLGAVAMVAVGVLTPAEAYRAVDLPTLSLLFGMMVLTGYLDIARFFPALSRWLLRRAGTPRALLGAVVWVSGLGSALFVNDTVCLLFTPVVLALCAALGTEPLPFLVALATSANIGSCATLTGNPQNMLIGTASGLPYREYLLVMGPLAVLLLALNHGLLLATYSPLLEVRREAHPRAGPGMVHRPLVLKSLLVLSCVVAAWLVGADLSFAALAGAAALVALARRDPRRVFQKLDWQLLLFFAALFVVVAGVERSGALALLREHAPSGEGPGGAAVFSLFSVIGSNLFSNVPFVLVASQWVAALPDPRLHWYLLALTSTLAGNLTLVGSMANLIVVSLARGVRPIGFGEYFRYGALITAVSTAVGALWLLMVSRFW